MFSQAMYAQRSAAFLRGFGKTEEAYYEEVARRRPELQFLLVENHGAVPDEGPRKSHEARIGIVRKELAAALVRRDLRSISDALRSSYEAQYHGPEVAEAEAVLAHIRKVHIKQMEAEAKLAERFRVALQPRHPVA